MWPFPVSISMKMFPAEILETRASPEYFEDEEFIKLASTAPIGMLVFITVEDIQTESPT